MPQKQKVLPETKAEFARKCAEGELSLKGASHLAGVRPSSVRKWIARYETEGVAGFLPHNQNRLYSAETKLSAVLDYLAGKGSYQEISEKYKLRSKTQLENWVKVYNAHGDFNSVKYSGGGSYMRQGRDTTLEERIQIAEECLASDNNYGEMALKYNVSYQQVRTWTLRYKELGKAGLEDRRGRRKKDQTPRTELELARIEIEQLKHELNITKMERDLLKKLDEVVRRDAYRK